MNFVRRGVKPPRRVRIPRQTPAASTPSAISAWALAFQGIQAVAGLGALILAIWAVFFSTLPEMLENQLRLEIVGAKEDLNYTRRINDQLLVERDKLVASGNAAQEKLNLTLDQLTDLETERASVAREIATLNNQRERYAREISARIFGVVSEVARYKLETYAAMALICSRYAEHRAWLEGTRELAQILLEWESQPFEQRYSSDNETYARIQNLQANRLPDFWLKIPEEPILEPTQSSEVGLVSELFIWAMNSNEDPEGTHRYLIDYLFSRTLKSKGAIRVTVKQFIEELKQNELISNAPPDQREIFHNVFDEFLSENPAYSDLSLGVFFDAEPSANEIVKAGKEQLPITTQVMEDLLTHIEKSASLFSG